MSRSVLVADDNLTIQRTASEILTHEDVEVLTVGNGMAAIKKLSSFRPLVVVADADMPGKDGYEVCDFVKSSPELSHIRVLIAVSDVEPYDQERGSCARVDGIVKKPFDPEELVSTVARCLDEAETLNLQSLQNQATGATAQRVGAAAGEPEGPAPPKPVVTDPDMTGNEESSPFPDFAPVAFPCLTVSESSVDSSEIPAASALPEHESHYEKFVESLLAERSFSGGAAAIPPPWSRQPEAKEPSHAGHFPDEEARPVFSAMSEVEPLEPEPGPAGDSAPISLPLVASVVHKVVARMAPSPLSPEMVRDIEQRLTDEIISELALYPC